MLGLERLHLLPLLCRLVHRGAEDGARDRERLV